MSKYVRAGCQNKKTFVIYKEWKEVVDALRDSEAGKLFKALLAHDIGQEIKVLPRNVTIPFLCMSKQVDFEKDKAQKTYDRNVKTSLTRQTKKKEMSANMEELVLNGTL
ncbi:hypothetical protein FACS189496_3630 [Bacilli bacterium]|nr:hypothetical protein FACS189496_3630 [Bacilli bacterium]